MGTYSKDLSLRDHPVNPGLYKPLGHFLPVMVHRALLDGPHSEGGFKYGKFSM